jgi:hypothetical protein
MQGIDLKGEGDPHKEKKLKEFHSPLVTQVSYTAIHGRLWSKDKQKVKKSRVRSEEKEII